MTGRRLYAGVALAGLLSLALATALATHAVLDVVQVIGLLGGDYGRHSHETVFPVALAAAAVVLCGALLYTAHLAGLDNRSLPWLARALRKRIGWRSVILSAVGASLALLAMESAEQLAAHGFDGITSAFGGAPLVGLGVILFIGSIYNALAAALCRWLANAHTHLVLVVAFLLRARDTASAATDRRARRAALLTFDYTWDVSQTRGKRAPPYPAR